MIRTVTDVFRVGAGLLPIMILCCPSIAFVSEFLILGLNVASSGGVGEVEVLTTVEEEAERFKRRCNGSFDLDEDFSLCLILGGSTSV